MPDAGLVLLRFVHYAALLTLFGVSLFPLYASADRKRTRPARRARGETTTLAIAASIGAVSGVALFVQVAANMVGSWSDLDRDGLVLIATDTAFGRIWMVHIVLAALVTTLVCVARSGFERSSRWLLSIVSGALLASMAGIGHAQDGAGALRVVHILADGLHLLAAGAWLGGIVALLLLVHSATCPNSGKQEGAAIEAAVRFAGLGYVAVATLILSGIIDGWILVGSFRGLVTTPYGELLMVKLSLFGAMLLLAALNRFQIVPALVADGPTDRTKAILVRLRRHILGEQAFGLLVILAVSALGTMEPAMNAMLK